MLFNYKSQMFVMELNPTLFSIRGNSCWRTEILIENLSSAICAAKEYQVSLKIRWQAKG